MKLDSLEISDCTITSLIESGIISESDALNWANMQKKKKIQNVHQYKIYQGKGQDPRWVTYVPDESKKDGRRKVIAPTEESLYEKLYEFYFGEEEKRRSQSIKDVYPEWRAYRLAVTNRANTIRRNDTDYRRFYLNESLSQTIISKPIRKLGKIELETWAYEVIRKHDMTNKQYNNMAVIIRQLLDYCVDQEIIEDNVFKKIRIRKNTFRRTEKKAAEHEIFYRDEIEAVIAAATEKADELRDETYLAIPLMKCLGLRISECMGLAFEDFDEKHHLVHIHRSMAVVEKLLPDGTWDKRRYEIQDYLKQNSPPRDVLASDECFEIVRHIRRILKDKGIEREFLFKVKTLNNVEMKLYRICDELEIFRRSPHKMRKTYVSALMNNGFDMDFVRTQVGHQDVKTTLNSYVFSTTRAQDNIERLNQVI